MIKSGQVWYGVFYCKDETGALSPATVGPVGTLYVNSVANAAVVTIVGANPYSWSVTLPVLTDGDCVDLGVTATINGIATAGIVCWDVCGTNWTLFPAGAIDFTYTVKSTLTGLPIEGVEVWISTDNPAVNIVWKGDTDAFGIAMDVNGNIPKLDAGTYYFWRQKAGFTFIDPDTEIVS